MDNGALIQSLECFPKLVFENIIGTVLEVKITLDHHISSNRQVRSRSLKNAFVPTNPHWCQLDFMEIIRPSQS